MIKNLFWNEQQRRIRTLWRMLVQFIAMMLGTIILSAGISILYLIGEFFAEWITSGSVLTALSPDDIADLSQSSILNALTSIATLISIVISVLLVGWLLDRRSLSDFGFHFNLGWFLDLGFGLFLGIILMAGVFLIEWLAGWITPSIGIRPTLTYAGQILAQVILFLCVGIYEELLSRGYQLLNLSEGLNFPRLGAGGAIVLAWVLTSILFGLGHFGNPNATFISTFNIALAGIFLGLGYVLTGELAIPIGLHITWNFFQGTVFGFPVSGGTFGASLITIVQGGPTAWTGGAFGPEAGILGILAMLIGSGLTLLWVKLRHKRIALHTPLAEYKPRPQKEPHLP
jgi:membrane protease YdiL (CAAX protease family)